MEGYPFTIYIPINFASKGIEDKINSIPLAKTFSLKLPCPQQFHKSGRSGICHNILFLQFKRIPFSHISGVDDPKRDNSLFGFHDLYGAGGFIPDFPQTQQLGIGKLFPHISYNIPQDEKLRVIWTTCVYVYFSIKEDWINNLSCCFKIIIADCRELEHTYLNFFLED